MPDLRGIVLVLIALLAPATTLAQPVMVTVCDQRLRVDSRELGCSSKVSPADLARIERLSELRRLSLTNSAITDAQLVHLKGLSKLRSLELSSIALHGSGLAYLKNLKDLRSLRVSLTPVQNKALRHLKAFPKLERLALTHMKLSTLASLPALKRLRHLDLRSTKIRSLKGVERLVALRSLDLRGTRIDSLKPIHALTQLRELYFGETAGLRGVRRLLSLRPDLELFGSLELMGKDGEDCKESMVYFRGRCQPESKVKAALKGGTLAGYQTSILGVSTLALNETAPMTWVGWTAKGGTEQVLFWEFRKFETLTIYIPKLVGLKTGKTIRRFRDAIFNYAGGWLPPRRHFRFLDREIQRVSKKLNLRRAHYVTATNGRFDLPQLSLSLRYLSKSHQVEIVHKKTRRRITRQVRNRLEQNCPTRPGFSMLAVAYVPWSAHLVLLMRHRCAETDKKDYISAISASLINVKELL